MCAKAECKNALLHLSDLLESHKNTYREKLCLKSPWGSHTSDKQIYLLIAIKFKAMLAVRIGDDFLKWFALLVLLNLVWRKVSSLQCNPVTTARLSLKLKLKLRMFAECYSWSTNRKTVLFFLNFKNISKTVSCSFRWHAFTRMWIL